MVKQLKSALRDYNSFETYTKEEVDNIIGSSSSVPYILVDPAGGGDATTIEDGYALLTTTTNMIFIKNGNYYPTGNLTKAFPIVVIGESESGVIIHTRDLLDSELFTSKGEFTRYSSFMLKFETNVLGIDGTFGNSDVSNVSFVNSGSSSAIGFKMSETYNSTIEKGNFEGIAIGVFSNFSVVRYNKLTIKNCYFDSCSLYGISLTGQSAYDVPVEIYESNFKDCNSDIYGLNTSVKIIGGSSNNPTTYSISLGGCNNFIINDFDLYNSRNNTDGGIVITSCVNFDIDISIVYSIMGLNISSSYNGNINLNTDEVSNIGGCGACTNITVNIQSQKSSYGFLITNSENIEVNGVFKTISDSGNFYYCVKSIGSYNINVDIVTGGFNPIGLTDSIIEFINMTGGSISLVDYTSTCSKVSIQNSSNVSILDSIFKNSTFAVTFSNSSRNSLTNCIFEGNGTGLSLVFGSSNNVISGNNFSNNVVNYVNDGSSLNNGNGPAPRTVVGYNILD